MTWERILAIAVFTVAVAGLVGTVGWVVKDYTRGRRRF